MTEMKKQIEELQCAVVILSRRLLRVETSEKCREYLRDIIRDVGCHIRRETNENNHS